MAGHDQERPAAPGVALADPAADRPAVPRPPRQTRGQARVDAILNAAAMTITEEGLAGMTMHALARRARTSIGSLYHFFPDRDCVLDGLRERHRRAVREINRQLDEIPAAVWTRLSVAATIERLVAPYFDYLQHQADFLPVMQGQMSEEDGAAFIRTIRHVLEARLPDIDAARHEVYAIVLHAAGTGIVQVASRAGSLHADACLGEIPRVLAAYLGDIEAAARQ